LVEGVGERGKEKEGVGRKVGRGERGGGRERDANREQYRVS